MEMQVLAFSQRKSFKLLLELECQNFRPAVYHSVEEFTSILDMFSGADILIIDEPVKSSEFHDLMEKVRQMEGKFNKILLLTDSQNTLTNSQRFGIKDVGSLLFQVRSFLQQQDLSPDDFAKIPADFLLHFNIMPFDLYLKVSDGKYIRRVFAHDEVDSDLITKLQERGVNHLYFEKSHNKALSNLLINNMLNRVEREYDLITEKFSSTSSVYATTKRMVKSLGLKPRLIQMCDALIDDLSLEFKKEKNRAGQYLDNLKTMPHLDFSYRFIHLSSFIVSELADRTQKEDTELAMKKLIYATFFCDMALHDTNLLHCRTKSQLQNLGLEEQEEYLTHAWAGAQLVQSIPHLPEGVAEIIFHHHTDELNIPPGLKSMVLCLRASHEISYALLTQENRSHQEILADLLETYKDSALSEYFKAFSTL